ncbi:SCO2525 family SAM-dependent methyltransferase [Couchioplanes caeruleus]|uniref:SCO2525 family SAM-dependent methyltransferase n=1 Tax=Couchioplanes caeruleus TaxID=56438 RepID=UPI0020BF38F3|nr:SCO2525 family SAM-dependent methyltransferase [Couchioplanes caeruleus]UQU64033.1 SCO2525 family SAM-dependent methyltransferase [Couchioplanes caeruleus]
MTQSAEKAYSAYGEANVQDVANADCDWDSFDSVSYFEHNYSKARQADVTIARIIANHFSGCFFPRHSRAIDVGAGANLYPALAMLPFADEVHLSERAESNRSWLRTQIEKPAASWTEFWHVLSNGHGRYEPVADFRQALRRRARVEAGNVFQLPTGVYNLGTMFFVAESITTMNKEFRRAVNSFVGSLKVGGPFAAAFMKDSSGYRVGIRDYPACPVDESDVRRSFAEIAHDVKLDTIEDTEVRSGYAGMIVVTGRAGKKK